MKEFFQGSFKLRFSLKKILYTGRQTIECLNSKIIWSGPL